MRPLVPIVISILAGIGWLIFVLLHTVFWSIEFDLFQNIVILGASLLIVALLIGLMWVLWGFKQAD